VYLVSTMYIMSVHLEGINIDPQVPPQGP
jgi:hypothetical protein